MKCVIFGEVLLRKSKFQLFLSQSCRKKGTEHMWQKIKMGQMQYDVLLGNSVVAGDKSGLQGGLFGVRRLLERFLLLDLLAEKVYQRQTPGDECEPFALLKTCP